MTSEWEPLHEETRIACIAMETIRRLHADRTSLEAKLATAREIITDYMHTYHVAEDSPLRRLVDVLGKEERCPSGSGRRVEYRPSAEAETALAGLVAKAGATQNDVIERLVLEAAARK